MSHCRFWYYALEANFVGLVEYGHADWPSRCVWMVPGEDMTTELPPMVL